MAASRFCTPQSSHAETLATDALEMHSRCTSDALEMHFSDGPSCFHLFHLPPIHPLLSVEQLPLPTGILQLSYARPPSPIPPHPLSANRAYPLPSSTQASPAPCPAPCLRWPDHAPPSLILSPRRRPNSVANYQSWPDPDAPALAISPPLSCFWEQLRQPPDARASSPICALAAPAGGAAGAALPWRPSAGRRAMLEPHTANIERTAACPDAKHVSIERVYCLGGVVVLGSRMLLRPSQYVYVLYDSLHNASGSSLHVSMFVHCIVLYLCRFNIFNTHRQPTRPLATLDRPKHR